MSFQRMRDVSVSAGRGAILAISATLAAAGTFSPAFAGEVHGRVVLGPGAVAVQRAAINPYPGMDTGAEEPGVTAAAGTPADVVIYIEGLRLRGERPASPSLTQVNFQFRPRVLGIPVGTVVTFPNEDAVFHNVFSYSKPKRFDLGYYGRGKSKDVTFDEPGIIKVFCDIHAHMNAFIVVADTPHITTASEDGSFKFYGVPDGTWTLKAWHPERGQHSQAITVAGGVTKADFKL